MKKRSFESVPTISYVPNLLPDELLYSYLARTAHYNCFGNPRDCLGAFWGTAGIIPSIDLPTALGRLQRRLGTDSPFQSLQAMIDLGTMYPYHRPFLSEGRHRQIQKILADGGGIALKTRLGRVANGFGANPSLRYCAKCLAADVRNYGVPYWHRLHQLPLVTVCAAHRTRLDVFLQPSQSAHPQEMHLAPVKAVTNGPLLAVDPIQLNFANTCRELIEANLPVLGPSRWQSAYLAKASELGFVDCNGRVLYDRIAEELRDRFDDFKSFDYQQRILSSAKTPLAWLRRIFGRPQSSSHPVFHVLLMEFLFGSVKEFLSEVEKPHASSKKNGGRQGSSASPFRTMLPNEQLRDESISATQLAKQFHLSVGTIVSRRRAIGISFTERRKRVTLKLVRRIQAALTAGTSVQAVAGACKVSLATVYRIRRETPGLLNRIQRSLITRERKRHRNYWLKVLAMHRSLSVTGVKKLAQACYAWLYRNDRAWLVGKNAGVRRQLTRPSARVDWRKRDADFSKRLEKYHQALSRLPDRPRISASLLLRRIGDATVRRNEYRLPQTMAIIKRCSESVDQYRKRRIRAAIDKLNDRGIRPDLWRIARMAGLKSWSEPLRDYALFLIEN